MYLDPSFGGMLIQIIIAIAVAGGAIAFGMRKKISAFFNNAFLNKKKNKDNTEPPAPAEGYTAGEAYIVDALSDDDQEVI